MSIARLIEKESGEVVTLIPSSGVMLNDYYAKTLVVQPELDGRPYIDIDTSDLPSDRSTRSLWRISNGEIVLAEPPEEEVAPATILRLLLEDVSDVDETKPILDAMLILLGG